MLCCRGKTQFYSSNSHLFLKEYERVGGRERYYPPAFGRLSTGRCVWMCLRSVLSVQFTVCIYEKPEQRAGSGRESLVIVENYRCCGLKIKT